MSRGLLGEAGLLEISQHLPDLTDLRDTILHLSPGFLPVKFPPESSIPIAAACLHDALRSVEEATYAFHEILAHRKWYLEKRETPNEPTAIFFSKFYADDVALRLYSAGEHLANALLVVGHYLINEYPNHPVTKAILKLVKSKGWLKTIKYRNDWVHNQPPTVEGLGIVYERRNRWIISEHGALLTFGAGDNPSHKIEDIVNVVRLALFLFIEVLTEVTRHYTELITEKGSSFA